MTQPSSLEKREILLDFRLLSDHLVSSDSSGMFLSQSICPFQSQQCFRGLFGTSGKEVHWAACPTTLRYSSSCM